MVDAVKILGALLGGGGMSRGSGADILKSVVGAAVSGNQGGGLGDLLGSVLGGGSGGNNPLGSILGNLAGGSQGGQGQPSGGLSDLVGGMLGGGSSNQSSSSGIDDLLGGLLGGGGGGGMDLGKVVGAALNQFGHKEQAAQQNLQPRNFEDHSPDLNYDQANQQATLLLKAMINAAKSDGTLDDGERENITGQLGQIDQDEVDFINDELAKPLDTQGFIREVPEGLGNQVYIMSLTAIDLDSNPEANYLHELATGLGIQPEIINQIHEKVGAPKLYG